MSTTPSQEADKRSEFDFWLGRWDLTWEGGQGINHIEAILDGRVIQERFETLAQDGLKGMSVSVYDERQACWCQTWVDNQGGYLDFTGGMQGDRMILSRVADIDGKQVHQRMVWYEIRRDGFLWNWERSLDEGKSWESMWVIQYLRAG